MGSDQKGVKFSLKKLPISILKLGIIWLSWRTFPHLFIISAEVNIKMWWGTSTENTFCGTEGLDICSMWWIQLGLRRKTKKLTLKWWKLCCQESKTCWRRLKRTDHWRVSIRHRCLQRTKRWNISDNVYDIIQINHHTITKDYIK